MAMRIPWHLHHSFLEHCVALPPLPKPEDIVINEPKRSSSVKRGASLAKRAKQAAAAKWEANRAAKKGKY